MGSSPAGRANFTYPLRAEVAHLAEHVLAKDEVAGSSPVFRSNSLLRFDDRPPFVILAVAV